MNGTITKNKLKSGRISWGYVCDAGRDANGKRRQVVRKGFATKHEAANALRLALGDHEKGRKIQKDSQTFGEFFRGWLQQHGANHWDSNDGRAERQTRGLRDQNVRRRSTAEAEPHAHRAGSWILLARGGRRTPEHPEGKPLSPKTVREIAALVSQALDKAVKWSLVDRNPMDDVERPAAHKREVRIPEPDEYEKFLDRVQGTRYYAFSVFAAASGCRRGELLGLQVVRYRFEDRRRHRLQIRVGNSSGFGDQGHQIAEDAIRSRLASHDSGADRAQGAAQTGEVAFRR